MEIIGRSTRIRTLDPLVPNQVRYQAALHSDLIYKLMLPHKSVCTIAVLHYFYFSLENFKQEQTRWDSNPTIQPTRNLLPPASGFRSVRASMQAYTSLDRSPCLAGLRSRLKLKNIGAHGRDLNSQDSDSESDMSTIFITRANFFIRPRQPSPTCQPQRHRTFHHTEISGHS